MRRWVVLCSTPPTAACSRIRIILVATIIYPTHPHPAHLCLHADVHPPQPAAGGQAGGGAQQHVAPVQVAVLKAERLLAHCECERDLRCVVAMDGTWVGSV